MGAQDFDTIADEFVWNVFLRDAPATDAERRRFWMIVDGMIDDPLSGDTAAREAAIMEARLGLEGERNALTMIAMFHRRAIQREKRAKELKSIDDIVLSSFNTVLGASLILAAASLLLGPPRFAPADAVPTLYDMIRGVGGYVIAGFATVMACRAALAKSVGKSLYAATEIREFLRRWQAEREAIRRARGAEAH